MEWKPEQIAQERPIIQALAAFSYDEYEQFSTGSRFVENLALWLRQFETPDERNIAYSFFKSRLVYVSQKEMRHLVETAFPEYVSDLLIQKVATETKIPRWRAREIRNRDEFKTLLRQSLFLALSDGSHIDYFRRCNNAMISQEQVIRSHEITSARASKVAESLAIDLLKILNREPLDKEVKFREVFLIDDFSGSGLSYLRRRDDRRVLTGKIVNFYDDVCRDGADLGYLIDRHDVEVHLILYIATKEAVDSITKLGVELFGELSFDVRAVYTLQENIRIDDQDEPGFLGLARKYYDKVIETPSYLKGKHDHPYLGFDECALPLVLFHNTPNNSLPLIWFGEAAKYRGCFPRVSRFRETQ